MNEIVVQENLHHPNVEEACQWFNDDDLSHSRLPTRLIVSYMPCRAYSIFVTSCITRRKGKSSQLVMNNKFLCWHFYIQWHHEILFSAASSSLIPSLIDELIIIMLSNAQIRRKIALTFFYHFSLASHIFPWQEWAVSCYSNRFDTVNRQLRGWGGEQD